MAMIIIPKEWIVIAFVWIKQTNLNGLLSHPLCLETLPVLLFSQILRILNSWNPARSLAKLFIRDLVFFFLYVWFLNNFIVFKYIFLLIIIYLLRFLDFSPFITPPFPYFTSTYYCISNLLFCSLSKFSVSFTLEYYRLFFFGFLGMLKIK